MGMKKNAHKCHLLLLLVDSMEARLEEKRLNRSLLGIDKCVQILKEAWLSMNGDK